jgi:hypothetical protein
MHGFIIKAVALADTGFYNHSFDIFDVSDIYLTM